MIAWCGRMFIFISLLFADFYVESWLSRLFAMCFMYHGVISPFPSSFPSPVAMPRPFSALVDLNGRFFGGRQVKARFYKQDLYDELELNEHVP